MEEFLLGLGLAGDELHVVHQQDVRVPVFVVEFQLFALADGLDQGVGKIVALDVDDLGAAVVLADAVGDGVDQVGLAQARVAVDQKGIVGFRRRVGHGPGGGVGKLVGFAHHEVFKGVFPRLDQGRGFCHDALAVGGVILVAQQADLKV